ncbi:hypothetical protein IMZ48_30095 [Candidatus Bathyarchaeota archaeon]|nr:hypothetical protein [Candidatus Bathyarchaeota archaeon]
MGKFFSRSSKSSPAPSENPYAQPNASQDPYANGSSKTSMSSHSSKSSGLPSGPRAGFPPGPQGGAPPPRPGQAAPRFGPPAPQPPPSYGSAVSGYGSDKHGSGGGYGTNPYDTNKQNFAKNQNAPVTSQTFRSGGYGGLGDSGVRPPPPGGLGRVDSSSTEVNRGDLFGGAKDRRAPQPGNAYDPTSKPVTGYGQSGTSTAGSGGYDGYGEERELTEEDKEQRQYLNTLAETKGIKKESAASIQRSVQTMHGIMDTQDETNSRLAYQGDSLFNAEKSVDMAENYNTSGYEKAKDLQKANSNMFAMHVGNPFTARSRDAARDEHLMERHRAEKGQREETRRNRFQARQNIDQQHRDMRDFENQSSYVRQPEAKDNPYAYEDDDEGKQDEEYINDGIAQLSFGVGRIYKGTLQTRETLTKQNQTIDRIAGKVSFMLPISLRVKDYANNPIRLIASTMGFGRTETSWTRLDRELSCWTMNTKRMPSLFRGAPTLMQCNTCSIPHNSLHD